MPLVVGHFVLLQGLSMLFEGDAHPLESDGFRALLDVLKEGNTWIEFSAAYWSGRDVGVRPVA
jgi:hypothetical protein